MKDGKKGKEGRKGDGAKTKASQANGNRNSTASTKVDSRSNENDRLELRFGKVRELLARAKVFEVRGHLEDAARSSLEASKMLEIGSMNTNTEERALLGECYTRLGSCAMTSKTFAEAGEYFEEALRLNPKDAEAMHGIAILINETAPGRAREAVEWLRASLSIKPDYTEAKRNLAMILTDIGVRLKLAELPSEATQLYAEALSVDPEYAQAYYNLGVAYADMGMKEQALEYYALTLHKNELHAEALCNAGVIHKETGHVEQAILNYERALSVNPNFELARANLSIALCDAGTQAKQESKIDDAFTLYSRALAFNPSYPDAHYNLGVAYAEERKPMRAIVHYELAVKFNPNHKEAHNNLGVMYKELGNLERSLESYKAALAIDSNNHQTHNNVAVVYTLTGDTDLAAKHLEMATRLAPSYAEAHNNIGVLLRDEGDVLGAMKHYEICSDVDQAGEMGRQNRLHALNYVDVFSPEQVFEAHHDWGLSFQAKILKQVEDGKADAETRRQLLDVSREKPDKEPRGAGRPLRIGYLSPDFFTHSVSYFIDAPLAKHSKQVKVFVYANVQKQDSKTDRLRAYENVVDTWRDIAGQNTYEAAKTILADKLDILVELAGHTNGNRLDVMVFRLAPVQVTWIGYPNTTGLPTTDYRVTDEVADPLNTTQRYTEKLYRLPKVFLCYTPAADAPEEVAPPPSTTAGGLVTFGSFNILAKMQSSTISLWAKVLKAVPNSRLLLKAKPLASSMTKARIQELFRKEDIDPSRLDMFPLIPATRAHLEAYRHMDVALDPFPYAGTTTTCEALYMGVPVITLASPLGQNVHAHNVGATLLTSIGHPELVAKTADDYVQKAVSLASDSSKLRKLRYSLRGDMTCSPLGRADQFVEALENMYFEMWVAKGGKRKKATGGASEVGKPSSTGKTKKGPKQKT
eukprot:CAMPEP_0184752864 /NCGR_PEP_ID=MMETSP0315-20130426/43801_1 /TAXON_ID=101924 /ORGANISM="Rhodosorus marinus, Strain UTEX LB 2760" /LENGTH=922 /DNA_ID=CAMNT_0027232217 /DNA_START=220 /DNA_END=2988 /DNA_ORIENTATION=-